MSDFLEYVDAQEAMGRISRAQSETMRLLVTAVVAEASLSGSLRLAEAKFDAILDKMGQHLQMVFMSDRG